MRTALAVFSVLVVLLIAGALIADSRAYRQWRRK